MKKRIIEVAVKVVVVTLTAFLTAITTTSCMGYGPFKKVIPRRMARDYFLSDAIEGSDQFLVGTDGATGHEIKDEGDGGQYGGPFGMELDGAPRLIAGHLAYDEIADIPSDDEQGVERTEEGLRLAVFEDEDSIGAEGGGGQQDGHKRPHIEMTLADGVGEPEVVDLRHIDASQVECTNLCTKTNDRQDDGHYQKNGLFTLPHKHKNLT